MQQLKNIIKAAGAAVVLAFAVAVPASAQTVDVSGNNGITTVVATDASNNLSVNGNCSAIIFNDVNQDQDQDSDIDQEQSSVNILNIAPDMNGNSQSASTSQSQSASFNFAPDCSVTNVTNVTHAAAPAAAPAPAAGGMGAGAIEHAHVPKGGVHAGAGGAVSAASSMPALVGLAGSLGSLGFGVALRKRAFEL